MKINTENRIEILKMSLELESLLNAILLQLFRIKKETPNTLGHKSSAISFKTKVDFLYDLERIDKNTYTDLIILMEIRNQFMHNLDADTFEIVINRIEKSKQILKLAPEIVDISKKHNAPIDYESAYKVGVLKLNLNICNSLSDVIKNINSEIEAEKTKLIEIEVLRDFVEILDDSMEEFADEFDEQREKEMDGKSELGKIIITALRGKFEKKLREKRGLDLDENLDLD